ncbi:MAG: MFS transporter [Bryobacteraceae bacterium]
MLLAVNLFVGATVGLERTVIPLVAKADFGLASRSVALAFLITFGIAKAFSNLFAGRLCGRLGRRTTLLAGWAVGLPVPIVLMFAPSWSWVVFANVLLGLNQGLCWSTTIIMKVDLAGPRRRGLAVGLNEFIGYAGVSLAALMTGYIAASYGLRPAPFVPGVAFALIGLTLSWFAAETRAHAGHEGATVTSGRAPISSRVFILASQAGLVTKINDGMVWGLLPLYWSAGGLAVSEIGVLAATFPGVWGVAQLATGPLSDRWGRKWMIVSGMWLQAAGMALFVAGAQFRIGIAGAAVLAIGTALVYPTLLAAISDASHPERRAAALGHYRFWRDAGFVAGALLAGALADRLGLAAAIATVSAISVVSGISTIAMPETLVRKPGGT